MQVLHYLSKKINNFFNWIYTKNGYYSLKSGLYFDHYFKYIFNRIGKEFNFFIGLIFMDAFIVNKMINSYFHNVSQFNDKIVNLKKKNNFYKVKQVLLLLLLLLLLIIGYLLFFPV